MSPNSKKLFTGSASSLALIFCLTVGAANAQPVNNEDVLNANGSEIVVTAERIRGSVDTDVPPIDQIDEKEIAGLGASSVTDILSALAPQAGSGRGRGGGGQPIVLVNGQRISGFRELRDLPPEAIKQVQIFPEEVALQYGYRPDQRVINFILKDNFASFNFEIEGGVPQDGGYSRNQFETTLTSIGKSTRININTEFEKSSRLTEKERAIEIDANSAPFTFEGDIRDFRTLLPATERFEINGTLTKSLAPQTTLSLNGNYRLDGSQALLGLPNANLTVPGSSPFSRTGTDQVISRYFNAPRALEREGEVHSARFGFSFNSRLAGWRWSATGDYSHIDNDRRTVRNADFTDLRAGVLAGIVDPFAPTFGNDLLFLAPDVSKGISQNLALANTLSGELFSLPAGPIQMTLRTGFNRETLDSTSIRANISNTASLRRNTLNSAVNIEVPLIARDTGPLGFLGEVSVNGNYGLSKPSDFSRLTEYNAGIRWSPTNGLTFQAALIGDENAPGIGALGNPISVSPNVFYFDFSRNETALISLISGGNQTLVSEKRRDLKLSVNWTPAKIKDLTFQVEYFRNRSRNTTASFPLLTPEIEAAFANRITRDTNGRLTSLDQRPVNYDEERSQNLRWGFSFSGGIGPQPQRGGGGFGGRGSGDRPSGASTANPAPSPGAAPQTRPQTTTPQQAPRTGGFGTGGFGGGGFGGPGGRPPGGWQLALYHTYQIQDDILIRPGIPRLDLLNGSATSNLGGTPRHRFELSGGIFSKGLGTRISGNYRSSTRANGSGIAGSSDLRFSDLATLNIRLFMNLDDRGNLTKKVPFLKGSRMALSVENVFNDIVDVRNEDGLIPLSYQPGYLDPKGRFFELSFRKRF
jgi:iron complex outermembrane recepter protein